MVKRWKHMRCVVGCIIFCGVIVLLWYMVGDLSLKYSGWEHLGFTFAYGFVPAILGLTALVWGLSAYDKK